MDHLWFQRKQFGRKQNNVQLSHEPCPTGSRVELRPYEKLVGIHHVQNAAKNYVVERWYIGACGHVFD
jgi:hypothetical protein